MARVAVIGGGFGGMAAAARLAKLGHRVTLLERGSALGGSVRALERDGLRWDLGPTTMPLPGAVRDLFRKSGRPLEKVVHLRQVDTPRRHLFADGSTLDLPVHSRSGQLEQLAATLGEETGQAWTTLIDGLESTWEMLRTRVLEVPYTGVRALGPSGLLRLRPWRSLRRFAGSLPDPRAGQILNHLAVRDGSDPGSTPWFLAVHAFVERTFGLWTCAGGLAPLAEALAHRLNERGVQVRLGTEAATLLAAGGTVMGVSLTGGGRLDADVVVCAVPLHRLLPTASATGRMPLAPPVRTLLLEAHETAPGVPFETVVHGGRQEPTLVLRAAADSRAWSLRILGDGLADPLRSLAERGMDLRDRAEIRLDTTVSTGDPVWRGARTARLLAPQRGPLRNLFNVGPAAHPGPGLPYVLLGAATVAQLIGKAEP